MPRAKAGDSEGMRRLRIRMPVGALDNQEFLAALDARTDALGGKLDHEWIRRCLIVGWKLTARELDDANTLAPNSNNSHHTLLDAAPSVVVPASPEKNITEGAGVRSLMSLMGNSLSGEVKA